MALDIQNGDVLAVGGREYRVKAVAAWDGVAATASFRRQATLTAMTLRNPAPVNGKVGAPEIKHLGLKCTPLDPVDPDTVRSMGLSAPLTTKQTFVVDETGYFHVFVEDLK